MRICSFFPGATEIIYLLGLGEDLYGVTEECDYPPDARKKNVIVKPNMDSSRLSQREIEDGVVERLKHSHDLYNVDRELIKRIKPDLVITQDLCEVCSLSFREVLRTVSELSKQCEVISLAPRGLHDVLEDITRIGAACRVSDNAAKITRDLAARIVEVERRSKDLDRMRVFCIEWFDPIFASGHWIPEMVRIAGGEDALGGEGADSRRLSWEDVLLYDPEVLILMPCGFDISRAISDLPLLTRLERWGDIKAVLRGTVYATNSTHFYSRQGPRLVDGLEFMARIIHPEEFPGDFPRNAVTKLDRSLLMPTVKR